MDAKLNHSDLSALLAEQLPALSKKSDIFTKAFFDLIIEGLETDGIVKVNGIGTFKITDVATRSSVNVNTGEKFEIKGHRKLSFIPADKLKERLNRPFAMFEPVEVGSDYVEEDDIALADDVLAEEEETVEASSAENKNSDIVSVATENDALEQESFSSGAESDVANTEEQDSENTPLKENIETEVVNTKIDNSVKKSFWVYFVAAMLLVVAIGAVFYYYVHSYDTGEEPLPIVENIKTPPVQEIIPDTIVSLEENDTVPEVFVLIDEIARIKLSEITLKDTTMYKPCGEIARHVVEPDETLTKISLKYYGDKRLWPYIVNYNDLNDHNGLAIGMEIMIPRLRPINEP